MIKDNKMQDAVGEEKKVWTSPSVQTIEKDILQGGITIGYDGLGYS